MPEPEMVSREVFATILDSKIAPLTDAIRRLEKAQETMVKVLEQIARQDERIRHLENRLESDDATHTELYNRLREAETKPGDRLWDIMKLFLAGLAGAVMSKLAGVLTK